MKPRLSNLAFFDTVKTDCTFGVECTVTLPDIINHEGGDVELWAAFKTFRDGNVVNKPRNKMRLTKSQYTSPSLKFTASNLEAA